MTALLVNRSQGLVPSAIPVQADRPIGAGNHRPEHEVRNHAYAIPFFNEPWRESVKTVEVDVVKDESVEATDDNAPEGVDRG